MQTRRETCTNPIFANNFVAATKAGSGSTCRQLSNRLFNLNLERSENNYSPSSIKARAIIPRREKDESRIKGYADTGVSYNIYERIIPHPHPNCLCFFSSSDPSTREVDAPRKNDKMR